MALAVELINDIKHEIFALSKNEAKIIKSFFLEIIKIHEIRQTTQSYNFNNINKIIARINHIQNLNEHRETSSIVNLIKAAKSQIIYPNGYLQNEVIYQIEDLDQINELVTLSINKSTQKKIDPHIKINNTITVKKINKFMPYTHSIDKQGLPFQFWPFLYFENNAQTYNFVAINDNTLYRHRLKAFGNAMNFFYNRDHSTKHIIDNFMSDYMQTLIKTQNLSNRPIFTMNAAMISLICCNKFQSFYIDALNAAPVEENLKQSKYNFFSRLSSILKNYFYSTELKQQTFTSEEFDSTIKDIRNDLIAKALDSAESNAVNLNMQKKN